VSLANDAYGAGTVCIPSCDPSTLQIVVFDGYGEMFVPGCVGQTNTSLTANLACRNSASFKPGVIYAKRLLLAGRIQSPYINFATSDTGDELHAYDVSLSATPGDMHPDASVDPYGRCSAQSIGTKMLYLSTSVVKSACAVDVTKPVYYVNVRPTTLPAVADKSAECGTSLFCNISIKSW
jgi:hypothetical protein